MYIITEKFCRQNENADIGQRTDIDKLLYTIFYVPLIYCYCRYPLYVENIYF